MNYLDEVIINICLTVQNRGYWWACGDKLIFELLIQYIFNDWKICNYRFRNKPNFKTGRHFWTQELHSVSMGFFFVLTL